MTKPLFHPKDPVVTDGYRQLIAPQISNTKFALEWLKTNPTKANVQRAILIELDDSRGPMRRGVLQVLLRRLRHLESAELEARIISYLKNKR